MNSRTKYLLSPQPNSHHLIVPGLHHLPNDALHMAAADGFLPAIQNILSYNPQLANQAHSSEGTIPLCWALQNNQTEAVALLIDHSHFPRIAPLPHISPLYYLNSTWANANPELTRKLLNNSRNALDYAYTFALESLDCFELSTLIQNYLMIVKQGQKDFLSLLDIGIKIKACFNKLYLSVNKHGYKTFYTLAAWINLSVCKSIFNQFSTEAQALIFGVVKNISFDDENFHNQFIHAIRILSPAYHNVEIDNSLESDRNYFFFDKHSIQNNYLKKELALVLFDAADYKADSDLAEKFYKHIEQSKDSDPEILMSLKKTANYINNANPHLAAKALLALQNETAMNNFKAAIVLRMMINAVMDRKINHTTSVIPRLIIGSIEKAIILIGESNHKNNYLGDFFEAAGDAYKTHLHSRYDSVYPLEPLKYLYATAQLLQSNPTSLDSTRNKLLAIASSETVQISQSSFPSVVGLFSRCRIRDHASIAAEATFQHSDRNNQFHHTN